MHRTKVVILDEHGMARGLRFLSRRDPALAGILNTLGPPPPWFRQPGFPTLIHIILEQQVSLASARAAMDRLRTAVSPLTPRRFIELDDGALRTMGFSRQKTIYGRDLAQAIVQGRLDLRALASMDDAAVRAELIQIKGIGRWTADIYLLMALRRPDIWPSGDLALAVALQRLLHLASRPTPEQVDALGQGWQPWRAVAARLLWHHYLSLSPTRLLAAPANRRGTDRGSHGLRCV